MPNGTNEEKVRQNLGVFKAMLSLNSVSLKPKCKHVVFEGLWMPYLVTGIPPFPQEEINQRMGFNLWITLSTVGIIRCI